MCFRNKLCVAGILFVFFMPTSVFAEKMLDFWDEPVRLFGSAKSPNDISRNLRTRKDFHYNVKKLSPNHNNIPLDINSLREPQEIDSEFSNDYTNKKVGDFSTLYIAANSNASDRVGFVSSLWGQYWNLNTDTSLHMFIKVASSKVPAKWPIVLIDEKGNRSVSFCQQIVNDGKWHEIKLPLNKFKSEKGFNYEHVKLAQFEIKFPLDTHIWFDGIWFEKPGVAGTEYIGVTDKSTVQRIAEAKATRQLRTEEAFISGSKKGFGTLLNKHFAKLWVGDDLEKVNQELLNLFTTDDKKIRSKYGIEYSWHLAMTPVLHRLYFNFSSKSKIKPGRLFPETEKALLALLWERTAEKNDIHIARQSTWWMTGSENHDLNAKVSSLLSSQIFMGEPNYAKRIFPDLGTGGGSGYWFHIVPGEGRFHGPAGRGKYKEAGEAYTAADHYEAWVKFFMEYITERARKGFFLEVASDGYMKHTLSFISDIYSYCDDARLREHTRKFLDIIWADWAQDQISGVRGGAKTRWHHGESGRDSMYSMALFYLGGPGDAKRYFWQLTNDYSFPNIIWEMALDREGMGEYAFISRKPGEEEGTVPRPLGMERTMLCNTESRFVRYSWVTPDYILGTQMDHPLALHSHLSPASRWQGMVFSTSPNKRVFPCALDVSNDDKWKVPKNNVYYRSVQHEKVLITQQCRRWNEVNPEWFPLNDCSSLPYGIYFSPGLDEIVEKDGWVFVSEGNAYLAVRVILGELTPTFEDPGLWMKYKASETVEAKMLTDSYIWNSSHTYLRCKYKYSPIIFEAARKADYKSFADFQNDILNNDLELLKTAVPGWYVLNYKGCGEDAREIYFNAANNEIPMIDKKYINYEPDILFSSPYMKSKYKSGLIILKKDDNMLSLDFNN